MPTAPDLQNRMKFWHFLNVLHNSWNLQKLLESSPETCMWNLRQFREVTTFDGKMPTAPYLQNRMKFWLFLNVLQNSWNLQNWLESPPETCMWNLRQFGEVTIFDGKMPTALDLKNSMKFRHFLNVLQNSWNLQNLLKSPPETCMWNLRQFGEVTIFDGKYLQRRTFKTGWNFDIFSMFSKIHETYRIYWNHHQKHACEIWGSSEKLQFLTEKCPQRRTFKTGWNLDIFSMFSIIHETYRSYWNHHQKPCMWNLRQFGEVTIFDRKMPTAPTLKNRMKLRYFLNVLHNSWNLQKLLESPPETCMWNLRQFREVTIFDRKMPTVPDLQNRMKFWHFLNVLQNSWNLQNLLESPPETCM